MEFSKIRPRERFVLVATSVLGIAIVLWLGRSPWQEAILVSLLVITGVRNFWVGVREHRAVRRSERE